MAYREVTMVEVREILRLSVLGRGKKRIAALLGLHVKTVRRYLRAAQECGFRRELGIGQLDDGLVGAVLSKLQPDKGRPHGEGWDLCQEHRSFVERYLEEGVRLTKIRKLLVRQGIEVSYASLWRFARAELGFGQAEPTLPVADGKPGEECQLDTGWTGRLEPDLFGRRRRFRSWIFTAVCSRHRFVYPSFVETTAMAIEACEEAWKFFGGVLKVIIPDNTKAIVAKADPLYPLINETFLEYAQARGFVVDPARARHARDKARVERAVPTVREDCYAGEKLKSLEHAREHGRGWCLRDYGLSRHTTTLRMPLEHFEAEERPHLLPLATEPYDVPEWCDPKVGRDHFAQVCKGLYSLPTLYIGKTLRARADRSTVRFYSGGQLVKTHPRVPPGKRSVDRNDFPADKAAYAFRDVEFLARKAQSHGEAVGAFARALLGGELPWTRMRRVYHLLGLARRYGSERLNAACETALAAEMLDVRRLAKMLEIAAPAAPLPSAKVIPIARYLRPTTQYALPLAQRRPNSGEDS